MTITDLCSIHQINSFIKQRVQPVGKPPTGREMHQVMHGLGTIVCGTAADTDEQATHRSSDLRMRDNTVLLGNTRGHGMLERYLCSGSGANPSSVTRNAREIPLGLGSRSKSPLLHRDTECSRDTSGTGLTRENSSPPP